mmetsp:Transcript_7892/g.23242  ORF Transcript_7892/g.23242 Transcript_7892/m.23242 type:complete len:450 (+) Transcript_7892:309-1658(+)
MQRTIRGQQGISPKEKARIGTPAAGSGERERRCQCECECIHEIGRIDGTGVVVVVGSSSSRQSDQSTNIDVVRISFDASPTLPSSPSAASILWVVPGPINDNAGRRRRFDLFQQQQQPATATATATIRSSANGTAALWRSLAHPVVGIGDLAFAIAQHRIDDEAPRGKWCGYLCVFRCQFDTLCEAVRPTIVGRGGCCDPTAAVSTTTTTTATNEHGRDHAARRIQFCHALENAAGQGGGTPTRSPDTGGNAAAIPGTSTPGNAIADHPGSNQGKIRKGTIGDPIAGRKGSPTNPDFPPGRFVSKTTGMGGEKRRYHNGSTQQQQQQQQRQLLRGRFVGTSQLRHARQVGRVKEIRRSLPAGPQAGIGRLCGGLYRNPPANGRRVRRQADRSVHHDVGGPGRPPGRDRQPQDGPGRSQHCPALRGLRGKGLLLSGDGGHGGREFSGADH